MILPVPPPPRHQTLARETRTWVRLVAERRGATSAAMRASLHTTRALAPEIAELIHARALEMARIAFADEDAAPDGTDLIAVIAQRYYRRWDADRQRAQRMGEHATVAMVLAYQRQQGM